MIVSTTKKIFNLNYRRMHIDSLMLSLILISLLFSSTLNPIYAQVIWDGDGDGESWNDPLNWNGDELPTSTDSVVIAIGAHVIITFMSEAKSVYLGSGDTLSQTSTPKISDFLNIDTGAVYLWDGGDMNWISTINNGSIYVNTSAVKNLKDSITLVNRDSGLIQINSEQQFFFSDGILKNYGQILLKDGADIRNAFGANLEEIYNYAQGYIIKDIGANSLILPDIINYGTIISSDNELKFTGLVKLEQETHLFTNDSSSILFDGPKLEFNGHTNGDASGLIRIHCHFNSKNGSISFAENGLIWEDGDFIDGDTLTNIGNLTLGPGGFKDVYDTSTIINAGTMQIATSVDLHLYQGTLINQGEIQLADKADIFRDDFSLIYNTLTGIIKESGSTDKSRINPDIINEGEITSSGDLLEINGNVELRNGSTINTNDTSKIAFKDEATSVEFNGIITGNASGIIELSSEIRTNGGSINFSDNGIYWLGGNIRNGDTLTNNGTMTIGAGTAKSIFDSTTLINQGKITIEASQFVTIYEGTIINKDTFCLGPDTDLLNHISGNGPYKLINELDGKLIVKNSGGQSLIKLNTINKGEIQAIERELEFATDFIFENTSTGILSGSGTIDLPSSSNFLNSGITAPGLSPGILTFDGDYKQDSIGIIKIELNGTTPGIDFDQVDVLGTADVNGTIDVLLDFQPSLGDTFDILTASGLISCDLADSVAACYNDEINVFSIHCLVSSIQLKWGQKGKPNIAGCKDITVYLDETGSVTVNPLAVLNDSILNCDIDNLSLSTTTFNCMNLGVNMVELTMTSKSQMTSCSTNITVIDTVGSIISVVYVDSAANGNNNGFSPAHAFTDLNSALNLSSGDCITRVDTIKVAKGTYFPSNMGASNRNSSFILPDSLILVGGYPSGMGIWNPMIYPTILDGNIGDSGSDDNVYHVVRIPDTTYYSELNGFIIQNGNADNPSNNKGAGINVKGSCKLSNLIIRKNIATADGSGIYVYSPDGNIFIKENIRMEENTGASVFSMDLGALLEIVKDVLFTQ